MTGAPGERPPRTGRHAPARSADPHRVVPPAPATIDLHTHTLRSDGILTPAELVTAAVDAGVRTLAITDHDTLAAYRELIAAGRVPGSLQLVPGVEINALVNRDLGLWEGELHILGFGMDPDDEAFEAALAAQRGERRTRFIRTVERLRDIGLPIDAQLAPVVSGNDDALGRPTIARALVAAGHAASVEDAFDRIIGHGKPGYVRRGGLGPEAAIAAIRAAGGVPVLAHFREAPTRPDILRDLISVGLAGLEVHYRTFDAPTTEAVAAVAADLRLLGTGGTDYHGDLGPYAAAHAELWVPPAVGGALASAIELARRAWRSGRASPHAPRRRTPGGRGAA
ncbi:MAG: PHP domain-containing protein [Candidatus Limnocylindria bacterium]